MSDIDEKMALVVAASDTLESFVMKYLLDNGVSANLVEVIARKLGGGDAVELVGGLLRSIVYHPSKGANFATTSTTPRFDFERLINEAAAFEFLVRYARKVNCTIIPIEVIPSPEVMEAMMVLFHDSKKPKAATGYPDYHGCGG